MLKQATQKSPCMPKRKADGVVSDHQQEDDEEGDDERRVLAAN
jgi:hypothetical protein